MFYIKLAEMNIGITTRLPLTGVIFRNYLTECKAPDFAVEVSAEDITAEREKVKQKDNISPSNLTDLYVERQVLLRKISEQAPLYGCMQFHGSAVAVDGKAYLFTAPSGTGKSTHSRLWRQMLGNRVSMINDDKPFLRLQKGELWVYGSPWQGKHNLGQNTCAPLGGICLLSQAYENAIERLSAERALHPILQQCYQPKSVDAVVKSLDMVERLLTQIPIYHLSCNMDVSAAVLSYETLTHL